MKNLHLESARKWREWLEKYHDSEREAWLIFYKKSTGKQTFSYREALDEALCFGWIDSREQGIDSERFKLRFTPRRKGSNWSKINIARFKKLLSEGKIAPAGKKAFDILPL